MHWSLHAIITSLFINCVICIEPFSIGAFVAAGLGIKYYDDLKLNTYCKFEECCHPKLIPHDIPSLQDKLSEKLFGQHIVSEVILKAVGSHYEGIEKSRKPLVMTFHGTQGTGKNYVTTMMAEAIFKKGAESRYFHLFHGSQYEGSDQIYKHREEVRNKIMKAIDDCPYSMFVFDEVDKMPPTIFNSITSILDHHSLVNGKDFRKAIFVFLTNYGGDEITKILYQLVNYKKIYREESKLHHYEEIMKLGVYNQEGGLQESSLIKSAVIDFYLPFLPLEKKHVVQCIKAEYENFGHIDVTNKMVEEIMKYIGFHESTEYAHAGCKTIYAKVQSESYKINLK